MRDVVDILCGWSWTEILSMTWWYCMITTICCESVGGRLCLWLSGLENKAYPLRQSNLGIAWFYQGSTEISITDESLVRRSFCPWFFEGRSDGFREIWVDFGGDRCFDGMIFRNDLWIDQILCRSVKDQENELSLWSKTSFVCREWTL